jgi:flagellar hook-associated protein 3 FlgL
MINRITDNIKFRMVTENLFNLQDQAAKLMEKLSTQKTINRPSDDPVGTNNVLNYRSAKSSIAQYQNNITNANAWLSLTDTNLSGIKDVISQSLNVATSESGGTASAETMNSSASVVSDLIDHLLSLLNAKSGDNYLFGGSRSDIDPFSANTAAASIGTAFAATANTFDGTASSGGAYTGTANKTYVVKIVNGGTPPSLANASYQVSSDGGKTWGAAQTDLSTPITLGDGITMSFTAGVHDLSVNDLFTVHGYAAGYYRGNEDNLTVQIAKDTNFAYNINGATAFTAANGPVAAASVVGAGAGLTANDTILLTRGATAGSWTLTNNVNYPNMIITSQNANTITIDANGDSINDITLSLSGKWSANNTASFTVTPGTPPTLSPVTIHGPGTVDLLTTLNALKTALLANDTDLVAAQIKDLQVAQTQVLTYQTQAGSKMDSLKVTENNNTAFNEEITTLDSKIEDADTAKLITAYQMKQTTLEAAYSMAAKIGEMTILNFLK